MSDVPMTAETYREMADEQRSLAHAATLPLVRERHLRSAARWDFLAQEADALQTGLLALFAEGRRAPGRRYA